MTPRLGLRPISLRARLQEKGPGRIYPFIRQHETFLVAVLSLIATYAFFCEYLPPFKRVHLWSDLGGYHYPLHRFAFQALHEGRLPLWDSAIYCGMTLIGNVQAA